MDNHRRSFQRLHQIRLHRFFKQRSHGLHRADILSRNRLAIHVIADQHPAQPFLQVGKIIAQTEHGHNLRSRCNLESALTHRTIAVSQPGHNAAQAPVIHVQDTFPDDALRIKP
ncbi:hypothetical protein D3C75_689970 [compost metagenome]